MRQAAPEAAEAPPAADAVAPGPAEAPVPPPLSAGAAFSAAFWDFKDRYGLLILCLVGAAVYLYYNYWKPAQDRRSAVSPGEGNQRMNQTPLVLPPTLRAFPSNLLMCLPGPLCHPKALGSFGRGSGGGVGGEAPGGGGAPAAGAAGGHRSVPQAADGGERASAGA